MNIIETKLPDVLLIEPDVFGDARGFFMETWNAARYQEAGFPDVQFVQDNHSRSSRGVLRGLHFQLTQPQGKLVQVVTGAVFDVAVDVRIGSPTFGGWVGYELSESNHRQLWVPEGFAHGFVVLSDTVDFVYKCTDFYRPEDEGGVVWNDSDLAIDWPLNDVTISAKDEILPSLAEAVTAGRLPQYKS